jgi:thiol-disulfide isomerase/thioredoxin
VNYRLNFITPQASPDLHFFYSSKKVIMLENAAAATRQITVHQRISAGLGVLTVMSVLLCLLGWSREMIRQAPRVGEVLPEFVWLGMDGQKISSPQFQGRRFVVMVFRPGCHHCRSMLLRLEEIMSRNGETLPVLAVSMGTGKETVSLHEELGLSFPLYCCAGDWAAGLRIRSVPVFLRIGEDGRIETVQKGLQSDPVLQELLQGQPAVANGTRSWASPVK